MRNVAVALIGAVGAFQPGKQALFRKRIVEVPTCARCRSAHDAQARHNANFVVKGAMIGAMLGILAGVVFIVNETVNHGFSAVIIAVFCCGTALGGVLGGFIGRAIAFAAQQPLPAGVRSPKYVNTFPSVVRMVADGWKIGTTEECLNVDATQFREVPPENETRLPANERCQWHEVRGEWIKRSCV